MQRRDPQSVPPGSPGFPPASAPLRPCRTGLQRPALPLSPGGRPVSAGHGQSRERRESMAGPGVEFTGRVSEEEKHRLMSAAWLLLHPARVEGWGIVVVEAAVRATPAIGFSVPGLRDSVIHNQTGVLVRTEGEFASAWASLAIDGRKRTAMGHAARERGRQLHWSAAVADFSLISE